MMVKVEAEEGEGVVVEEVGMALCPVCLVADLL
jgi:hypothetical protein